MSDFSNSSSPAHRLSDRVDRLRKQNFVGRAGELELFRAALQEREPFFSVLYLHGPGGIGKSTLLQRLGSLAREAGAEVVWMDGRSIDPTPHGFCSYLHSLLGTDETTPLHETLSTFSRCVLLIDTYEALAALDLWLPDRFLPELPANSLVVLAGRNLPSPVWTNDSGWHDLIRIVSLRNLRPEESQAYLHARGVSADFWDAVLAITHGHPLALSLMADAAGEQGADLVPEMLNPEARPDVIRFLLERFNQHVPGPLHRQAVEICAHARVTSEGLLASVLGIEDAHPLFTWLRDLSFIETGMQGLFPHDLARDVLDLDFRWRNPDGYLQMHKRIRTTIVRRITETRGLEQQRAFMDLLYLHRNHPLMKPFYDWESLGGLFSESAQPADYPLILETISRYEGEQARQIARFWLERQPQAFQVIRAWAGKMQGFIATLAFKTVSEDESAVDPAVHAAWNFIQRRGPLRSGDEFIYHRFSSDIEHYHDPSPSQSMFANVSARLWFTKPNLAWSLIAYSNPDFWRPSMTYLNQHYTPEAAFVLGELSFGVFTHDWRAEPLLAWLETMEEREQARELDWESLERAETSPMLVLSQPEFEEAVRQALRAAANPAALQGNPLLRSRLVRERAGEANPQAALQALIYQAAESLKQSPKEEKFFRALVLTYLDSAPTQEAAAERLGLPFSTYRYHLSAGIERVVDWLWQQELYCGRNLDKPEKT